MKLLVRQSAFAVLTITAGAALLVQACRTAVVPPAMLMAERPECPHDWNSVSLQPPKGEKYPAAPVTFPANGQLELAGLITGVPEFHDCQRFITQDENGSERYTGFMAIFARNALDTAFASAGHSLVLGSTGIWVAIIAAEEDYRPLDIRYGFNCLALRRTPAGGLEAMMVARSGDQNCGEPPRAVTWESNAPKLRVTATHPASGESVPAVARWDWDAAHGRQYIGVQCGTAWCEVYSRDGYQPSESNAVTSGAAQERQVVNVKGWYDSQRLAKPVTVGTAEPIEPSALRSNVYPAPDLDRRSVGDYHGKWRAAAYVTMPAMATYAQKMGLEAASGPPTMNANARNAIGLCHGTATACSITDAKVAKCHGGSATEGWFARIRRAGFVKEFCVMYRPWPTAAGGTVPFTVPGVVRWRWKAKDETVWISCPQGCCEVVVDEM